MANGSFFSGSPTTFQQVNRFDPRQQQTLQQLLGMGMGNLQNPSQGFGDIARGAEQRFQQQTVPGLLQRFSSAGDMDISSPSLKAELSQAGGSLQERLAGLESQYRNQREGLGLQQLQLGLQPSFDTAALGEQGGFGQAVLPGLGLASISALSESLPYIGAAFGHPEIGAGIAGLVKLLAFLSGNKVAQPPKKEPGTQPGPAELGSGGW